MKKKIIILVCFIIVLAGVLFFIINKMQIFTITAYNADYILAKEENFQKL